MIDQIAEFFREGRRRPAPGWFIGLCRIVFGLMWLYGASSKAPPSLGQGTNADLWHWIQQAIQRSAFPWYRSFLEGVAAPNFAAVGWLVFLFELCVGSMLLVGFLTRIFATVGLIMSLNLLVGLATISPETCLVYVLMALFHALFIMTNAGLNWGVDQILLEKLANTSLRQTGRGRLLIKLL